MKLEDLFEVNHAAMRNEWERQNKERLFLQTKEGVVKTVSDATGLSEHDVQKMLGSVGVSGNIEWCVYSNGYVIAGSRDIPFKMPKVYSWSVQSDPKGETMATGEHQRNGKISVGGKEMYFSVVDEKYVQFGFHGKDGDDRGNYFIFGIVSGAPSGAKPWKPTPNGVNPNRYK